jgi:membrane protein implicated in regulation of membrane protease activity
MHWVWMIAGLLVLGAACGALLRLLMFIGVLLGAAVIAFAISMGYVGVGAALLNAFVAVIVLQAGYALGVVLRAAIRSLRTQPKIRAEREQRVPAPFGEKRQ